MQNHAQLGSNHVHAKLLSIYVLGNRPIISSIFAGPACRYVMYCVILLGEVILEIVSIHIRDNLVSTKYMSFFLKLLYFC